MNTNSHMNGFAPLGVFIFLTVAFVVVIVGAGVAGILPKPMQQLTNDGAFFPAAPKYVFAEALQTIRGLFGSAVERVSSDGLHEVAAIPIAVRTDSALAPVKSASRRVAKSEPAAVAPQTSAQTVPQPMSVPAPEQKTAPSTTPITSIVKPGAVAGKSAPSEPALEPGMSRPSLAPPKPPRFLLPAVSSSGTSEPAPSETAAPCHYSTGQTPSHSLLTFNEIAWMGSVTSSSDEWMELKNVSGGTLDISGWQLIDSGEQIHVTMPAHTIVVQGGLLLLERTNDDTVPGISADIIYTGALGNTSDGVRLFDTNCLLHDEALGLPWPAGNAAERRTMERASDFSWYTSTALNIGGILGTPKAENSPRGVNDNSTFVNTTPTTAPVVAPTSSSVTHIVISEVRYGITSNMAHAFVELYNPADSAVAMTGWSLKKKSSTGTESSFVSATRLEGKTIAGHGYFLLVNDGGYTDAVTSDATWAASYSLVKNNGVVLYDASAAKVDELSWTEVPDGASVDHNAVQLTPNPQNSASAHGP